MSNLTPRQIIEIEIANTLDGRISTLAFALAIEQAVKESLTAAPDGWREIIEEMAADIEGYVRAAYTGHPSQQRKLDRDMEVVMRARAMLAAPQPTAEPLPPVYGDVLPAIGSRVFIRHGRDSDAHACIVTGYWAWKDFDGSKHLHRVFVRLVYEGSDTQQGRMLCDVWPTAEAALASDQQPTAEQSSEVAPGATQGCAGFQGQPVDTCGVCRGAGCDGDSESLKQPAPALDEQAAFEDAMADAGYHVPERGDAFATQYLFQRDQDRFDGFQMARAALTQQRRDCIVTLQSSGPWRLVDSNDSGEGAQSASAARNPDPQRMRGMLMAMQAGEMTVSRGVELLDMWLYGSYSEDDLPPIGPAHILGDDSMPWEVIDALKRDIDAACAALSHRQQPSPVLDEKTLFSRRFRIASDGFGLQRDDRDGNYVALDDAVSVLHAALSHRQDDTELLRKCADWCEQQAKSDWYGKSASDMVRAFAARLGEQQP